MHRFRDIATYWSKITNYRIRIRELFYTPAVFVAPVECDP